MCYDEEKHFKFQFIGRYAPAGDALRTAQIK